MARARAEACGLSGGGRRAEEGADVDGYHKIGAHISNDIGRDGRLETAIDERVTPQGDGASPKGRADACLDGDRDGAIVEDNAHAAGHVVRDDGEGDSELSERESSVGAPEFA
jgi:hypothetical protein